jgi:hypothetical protein
MDLYFIQSAKELAEEYEKRTCVLSDFQMKFEREWRKQKDIALDNYSRDIQLEFICNVSDGFLEVMSLDLSHEETIEDSIDIIETAVKEMLDKKVKSVFHKEGYIINECDCSFRIEELADTKKARVTIYIHVSYLPD